MHRVKLAVRELVEFILRSGDIDTRFVGRSRMQEGSRLHRLVQSGKDESYHSEYFLKDEIQLGDTLFLLEGRADGLVIQDGVCMIDEIKSTGLDLDDIGEDHNPLHWAQAKCYGYIYGKQQTQERMCIQLTYIHLESLEIKNFQKEFPLGDLEVFVMGLLQAYQAWADYAIAWEETRRRSLQNLEFPFPNYRKEQRKLAVCTYNTILQRSKLYASAPTGIGKTISTIFPSLKAMGEDLCEKIFYLTAKEITRTVAEDTLSLLRNKGLRLKSLTLTAKSKICFCEEQHCNPEDCPYAAGHFDRVGDALMDILTHEDAITKILVEEYARKHRVCPFEYSLDISNMCDLIICDYNYAFDPKAKLKRYFVENYGEYVFLVDEAHNLVDRAREMFSAEVTKAQFWGVRKVIGSKRNSCYKVLGELNKFFLSLKKDCGEEPQMVLQDVPEDLAKLLERFLSNCENWLKKNAGAEGFDLVLDGYFTALSYLRIAELYDSHYCTLISTEGRDLSVKLVCLDPSKLLEEGFGVGRAAIVFSATLSPLSYYLDVLGGNGNDHTAAFSSPFNQKNLCLLAADFVSTKYARRAYSYEAVADIIHTLATHKQGNYLIYFPSYKYLGDVYAAFTDHYPDIPTLVQSGGMSSEEQRAFLDQFSADNEDTLVGFSVLGGAFAEGIDLLGDRLIGTAIVGVGLPQVNIYQNMIRDYYDHSRGNGFDFAYTYPGINKVMQAAGRVIRTEQDRGVVLLIDDRFATMHYRRLFPRHWNHLHYVHNMEELMESLEAFSANGALMLSDIGK